MSDMSIGGGINPIKEVQKTQNQPQAQPQLKKEETKAEPQVYETDTSSAPKIGSKEFDNQVKMPDMDVETKKDVAAGAKSPLDTIKDPTVKDFLKSISDANVLKRVLDNIAENDNESEIRKSLDTNGPAKTLEKASSDDGC